MVLATGEILIRTRVQGMKQAQAAVEKSLRHMSGRSKFYAGLIQTRVGGAMIGMGASIATALGNAVKEFSNFDKAMKDIEATTFAGEKQMLRMADAANKLGIEVAVGPTVAAEQLLALAKAGVEAEKALTIAGPTFKLAIARSADLGTTTELLVTSMNALGAEFSEVDRFADTFAAATAKSFLTVERLKQSFKFLGPVVKEFGISVEETTALLALLADQNIVAGQAGRPLRRMLQGLVKDTNKTRVVLKDLGLNFSDLDVKTRGITAVMNTLRESNITAAQTFQLFGLRASGTSLGIKNAKKSLEEYFQLVSQRGFLQKQFSIQTRSLDFAFKQLKASTQLLNIAIGKQLAPAVHLITDAIALLFRWVASLPEPILFIVTNLAILSAALLATVGSMILFQGWITLTGLSAKRLAFTLRVVLLGSINTLRKGLVSLTLAMGGRGAALGLAAMRASMISTVSPALKLHGALIGLSFVLKGLAVRLIAIMVPALAIGAILASLVVIIANVRVAFETFRDDIKMRMEEIADFIGGMVDAVKAKLEELTKPLKDFGQNIKDGIVNAIPEGLRKKLGLGLEKVKEGIEKVGEVAASVAPKVKDFAKDQAELVKNTTLEGVRLLKEDMNALLELVQLKAPGAVDMINQIKEAIGNLGNREAVEDTSKDFNKLGETVDDVAKRIKQSWGDAIQGLLEGTMTWKDVFEDIQSRMLRNFIDGFLEAMVNAWGKAIARMIFATEDAQAGLGGGTFKAITSIIGGIAGLGSGLGGAGGGTGVVGSPGASSTVAAPSFRAAEGGIVNRPAVGLVGEAGPEAIIPLDQLDTGGGRDLTIINVVDKSFVNSAILDDPNTVINIISRDIIRNGTTRSIIKDVGR